MMSKAPNRRPMLLSYRCTSASIWSLPCWPITRQEMAYAAIDAGADLILGHHAHILKGAEVYKGKNIFYSLCNFGIDLRMDKAHAESKSFKEIQKLNPDWIPDFEALYNFPTDSQKTIVIKCLICRQDAQKRLISSYLC